MDTLLAADERLASFTGDGYIPVVALPHFEGVASSA